MAGGLKTWFGFSSFEFGKSWVLKVQVLRKVPKLHFCRNNVSQSPLFRLLFLLF